MVKIDPISNEGFDFAFLPVSVSRSTNRHSLHAKLMQKSFGLFAASLQDYDMIMIAMLSTSCRCSLARSGSGFDLRTQIV